MTELAAEFADFFRHSTRAPLYAQLSVGLANWSGLPGLFAEAPAPARLPVNLFAAVHYLLLGNPQQRLARFYPNLTPAASLDRSDLTEEFIAFCQEHHQELVELLATRLPQTNEIGRSALLVAGLGQLPPQTWAQLDVGASAGLNLMLDRLSYQDQVGVIGDSKLRLNCEVSPDGARLAAQMPQLGSRLGLDARPVDLRDPDAARWLQACVWPDQTDRFALLERAVAAFTADPIPVLAGDAVRDLVEGLGRLEVGSPVITTSWALCYLDPAAQHAWAQQLALLGAERELTWLWIESPARVPVLPVAAELIGKDQTILGVSTWRKGQRIDRSLARCHPHGYWLSWLPG